MHIQVQDLPSTFSHWLTCFDAAECCFLFFSLTFTQLQSPTWVSECSHTVVNQHHSGSAQMWKCFWHVCCQRFMQISPACQMHWIKIANIIIWSAVRPHLVIIPEVIFLHIFSWTFKGTFGKWKMIGGNFGNKQHLRDKWIKTDEAWYGPSDFNQSPAHLPYNRQFSWDILT